MRTMTTITSRGMTYIPADIRKRLNLKPGTKIEWIETGDGIKIFRVPEDAINYFWGIDRGKDLMQNLYNDRKRERERE